LLAWLLQGPAAIDTVAEAADPGRRLPERPRNAIPSVAQL